MRCKQWIFDMDGTLTDSMTVVWRGAPLALLQRYGRTPKADLNDVLLTMGMADGARYLIREYGLPLTEAEYYDVMRDVIAQLYETVDLKPGVRTLLAKLQAEGARLCLCSNTWSDQCRTVLTRLGIPPETVALMLVRPVSGSAALGVGAELISTYGPDSQIGRTAAVMLGSTETTFYTIAVYFGAAGIVKTRYAVPAALCADLAGFMAAAWAVRVIFH